MFKNILQYARQIISYVKLILAKFKEDGCYLRASALTFYSLLSTVPLIAMVFGIAKGFGFQKILQKQLSDALVNYAEVADKLIVFSESLLNNTRGGLIAGIGVFILFWTVIKLLGNVEASFNYIWKVETHRTLLRKITDYLSILLICPFFFIIASSITMLVQSKAAFIFNRVPFLHFFTFLLNLLPYVVVWILFAFLYCVFPNRKVSLKVACIAGVLAGSLYQIVQWAYVAFQIGTAKYGAIYGSFAALPLFLVWLQLSWFVLLFGVEIAYFLEYPDSIQIESYDNISLNLKKKLHFVVVFLIVQYFRDGKYLAGPDFLAKKLGVPKKVILKITDDLIECGLINKICNKENQTLYQPHLSLDKITVGYVLDKIETFGCDDIEYIQGNEFKKVSNVLENVDKNLLLTEM